MKFDRLRPGQRELDSANENRVKDAVEALFNVTFPDGYAGPTGLHGRRGRLPPTILDVLVGTSRAVGVYNGSSFSNPPAYGGTAVGLANLGTQAASSDLVVLDPEQRGLAAALPLNGLATQGRVIGQYYDAGTTKTVVVIPPPGVRDVRFNTTTGKLQVAYLSSPTESHWVDKITFYQCP